MRVSVRNYGGISCFGAKLFYCYSLWQRGVLTLLFSSMADDTLDGSLITTMILSYPVFAQTLKYSHRDHADLRQACSNIPTPESSFTCRMLNMATRAIQ
jgi:hypothetical protein